MNLLFQSSSLCCSDSEAVKDAVCWLSVVGVQVASKHLVVGKIRRNEATSELTKSSPSLIQFLVRSCRVILSETFSLSNMQWNLVYNTHVVTRSHAALLYSLPESNHRRQSVTSADIVTL